MSSTPNAALGATEIAALADRLRGLGRADSPMPEAAVSDAVSEVELIDQLRALEELKASVAAAQVRVTAAFATSQQRHKEQPSAAAPAPGSTDGMGEAATGGFEAWQAKRDADRARPSVGAQIALARRLSPYQGAAQLTLAQALVHELPGTLAALEAGVISEWRATIIARESSSLTTADRAVLDAEITTDPDQLSSWGDKELASRVRAVAYRLDAHTAVERAARAAADRRVSLRPKPDVMCALGALLPVTDGIAAYASLDQAATTARALGDPRSRGQIMADTLVQRLTGHRSGQSRRNPGRDLRPSTPRSSGQLRPDPRLRTRPRPGRP